MAVMQRPGFLPVLAATVGLFRHARRGLADPSLLPSIERAQADASLDPQWLAAYCACVGLQDDRHLPPLALQIAAAPLHMAILGDARFPFRALGMVHLTQRVVQTRPLPSLARYDLRAFCADARWEKRGMSFGLVTEARCDGEVVWRGETRALAPGKTPAAVTAPTADAPAEPADVADSEQVLRVPESTGRRYAAIAGDLNPIHQHALLARLFGFRRAIVHGTWTLARALAVAGLPQAPAFALDARFRRPVELPSDVVVRVWCAKGGDAVPEGAPAHRILVSPKGGGRTCVDVELVETTAPS
jgi:acyl dehydratase